MENLIISLGTDCTLFHGFVDYLNYRYRENGVKTSPFAGTWIYDENNRPGEWRMNYGSLGIVAELIETKFKGWDTIKKNFRGKPALAKYPIEFTYYNADDPFNQKATSLFLEILQRPKPLIFCSVWRPYIGFNAHNLEKNRADIFAGLDRFKRAVKSEHRIVFFFVVNRSDDQIEYIKNLMRGSDIKYGILYNEKDEINTWRAYTMKFDCTGWEQALRDTGLK